MTFPVALIHPDNKKDPARIITAKDQAELDRLLKLGWKVK
jgi:hypothetical protein